MKIPLSFPIDRITALLSGEVEGEEFARTHQPARLEENQATAESDGPPDALVPGSTTGETSAAQVLLKDGPHNPELFPRDSVLTLNISGTLQVPGRSKRPETGERESSDPGDKKV